MALKIALGLFAVVLAAIGLLLALTDPPAPHHGIRASSEESSWLFFVPLALLALWLGRRAFPARRRRD